MMKHWRKLLVLFVFAALASPLSAQNNTAAAFEKLKSLEGVWQGENPEGKTAQVSYKVVSGGHAVLETIEDGKGPGMVSLYHLDGDRIMMTHYCSAGNQPRMQATAPGAEIRNLNFSFVDATNLAKPGDGRMNDLDIGFVDNDHMTQVWTWKENGKKTPYKFELERKK